MKQTVCIVVLSIAAMALASSACIPVYQPPPRDAAQASVELSITYHVHPDAFVSQTVQIDGVPFEMPAPQRANDPMAEDPITKWVSIPVHRTHWRVASELSVMDFARVYGPVVVREESTCPAGIAACGEPRIVNRDHWPNEPTVQAACAAELKLDALPGRSYILEYDFYGDQECTLRLARSD